MVTCHMDEDELCSLLTAELDIESKYFQTMPYDSDDPDFDWHKYQSWSDDSEAEERSTNAAPNGIGVRGVGIEDCKIGENMSKSRRHGNRRKKKHRTPPTAQRKVTVMTSKGKATEVTSCNDTSEFKTPAEKMGRSSDPGCIAYNMCVTPTSDSDEDARQALHKHRRLISCRSTVPKKEWVDDGSTTYVKREWVEDSSTAYVKKEPADDNGTTYVKQEWVDDYRTTYVKRGVCQPIDDGSTTYVKQERDNGTTYVKRGVCQWVDDNSTTYVKREHIDDGNTTYVKQEQDNSTTYVKNEPANDSSTAYPLNIYPSNSERFDLPNLNSTFPPYAPRCSSPPGFSLCNDNDRYRTSAKRTRWSSSYTSSGTTSPVEFKNPSLADAIPHYKKYQLLGDSQLLRFSEQLLNFKSYVGYTEKRSRRLGYCVSGQKIGDLLERLQKNEYKLAKHVIMLIGTNDLVYDTQLKKMCEKLDSILNILKNKGVWKIVILTVPPVPKLDNNLEYWTKFRRFNNFVMSRAEEGRIFTLDLASLYISYDNKPNLLYFEKFFDKTARIDLVHLNREGFKLLKAVLDINYFDKYRFECMK